MEKRLSKYEKLWGLTEPKLIAKTPTSHVFTVRRNSEELILKLLTPVGVKDEGAGRIALDFLIKKSLALFRPSRPPNKAMKLEASELR